MQKQDHIFMLPGVEEDWIFICSLLNEMFYGQPESFSASFHNRMLPRYADQRASFDWKDYYLCIMGLPRTIYNNIYGFDYRTYSKFCIDHVKPIFDRSFSKYGLCGITTFLTHDNRKQLISLFHPVANNKKDRESIAFNAVREMTLQLQETYVRNLFYGASGYANVAALSPELKNYGALSEGFAQTLEMIEHAFFFMKPCVMTREHFHKAKKPLTENVLLQLCKEFETTILGGKHEDVEKSLKSLFLVHLKSCCSFMLCWNALNFIKNVFTGIELTYGFEMVPSREDLFNLKTHASIETCYHDILQAAISTCDGIAGSNNVLTYVNREAVYYIKTHYSKNLTLELIAQHVHVSAPYLSRTFKKALGICVSDYIIQYRLSKGKELLKTSPMRINKIAEAVGIPNARYFSNLFKRHYGVTAQEYRLHPIPD